MRSKRNIRHPSLEDIEDFDPLHDLEKTKLNLKKYIVDENRNDQNLLHELEENLGDSGWSGQEDFLDPEPVKEESVHEDLKDSPEKLKFAKVIKLLIIDALKVDIKDAKEVAAAAVSEVDPYEVLLNWKSEKPTTRRKRSVSKSKDKLHKEAIILRNILKEIGDLQALEASNQEIPNKVSQQLEGTSKGSEDVQSMVAPSLEPSLVEGRLLEAVTTLLSRSAVDHMVNSKSGMPTIAQVRTPDKDRTGQDS